MRVEKHEDKNKFERLLHREIERKFIPLFPERVDQYRNEARPIEQYYLSHPDEAFSLRFRELLDESGVLCAMKQPSKTVGTSHLKASIA